jgi:hypothetical protein
MGITERLKKKGWTKREIDKTLKIVEKAKKNKHPTIKFLDSLVYWIALIAAIVGNFIISLSLIPFLLFLNPLQLYAVVVTIGIAFGLLFELLIRSITYLKTGHHLFFGFLIPIIAIINFFIVTIVADYLFLGRSTHNPFIVAVVYAAAFIAPYASYHLVLKE